MALFRRRHRAGEDKVGRRVVVTDDLGLEGAEDYGDYEGAEEYAEYDDLDDAPERGSLDSSRAGTGDGAPGADGPATPREETGPFDHSEVEPVLGDRLDLGCLWLGVVGGAQLRIELDPNGTDIQAVTTDLDASSMQVQAFAAPRTSGIWRSIRGEIADSVTARGGAAEEETGPLGTELLTRLPSRGPDGRTTFQVMRFVGVDGPRWFLRAVLTGPAAADPTAAEPFYAMIRNTVVVRGDDARPPREMLPLRMPKELLEPEAAAGAPHIEDFNPFERGPEITEIR